MRWVIVLVLCGGGCVEGIDPRWQLDHDRLVAVRASPPHVAAGVVSKLDALVAHRGAPTDLEQPTAVMTVAPAPGLAISLQLVSGAWSIVGLDDTELAPARTALGLDPTAAVPLELMMTFPPSNGVTLTAIKTVWLGDSFDNPALGAVTIDGGPPDPSITIASEIDVHLSVGEDPTFAVDWLTSCGTMHDDNEHEAFINVQASDPKQGELAVVVHDVMGGVVWQVWPIQAE